MDIKRILDKFDSLMREDAFLDAEKHLLYWLNEAEVLGDLRGKFTILNEMTGFYRMRRMQAEAEETVVHLLKTIDGLKLDDIDISRATAYLNIATCYNSFAEPDKALEYYHMALKIYDSVLDKEDDRLAALYNNMAMAQASDSGISEQGRGKEVSNREEKLRGAEKYLKKALSILEMKSGSENEQAITYLNLADVEEKISGPEAGEEKILQYVEKASSLLDKSYENKNPDYKQTAEKCLSVFQKYGYFAYANLIKERLKKIKL